MMCPKDRVPSLSFEDLHMSNCLLEHRDGFDLLVMIRYLK